MGSATEAAAVRTREAAASNPEAIAGPPPDQPKSTAETLRELRNAFPDSPLAERVAALKRLARR
jgi:hypothetical protein